MRQSLIPGSLILLLAMLPSPPAGAAQPADDAEAAIVPQLRTLSFIELERAEGLAAAHLNELWRVRALRALKLDDPGRALDRFRMAARHADKFSQHSLSLMHWHGVGTARDRALAYVWSDLAAERGYRDLLLVREKMWQQMSAEERRRALEIGPELYAVYGDEVAQPRMEWALRQARADVTGSRLGATLDRVKFGRSRGDVAPRDFFASERWQPERYWQAEGRQWDGRVIVLPVEKVEDEDGD
ncbi:hypothetical protein [Marilutibacter chinensis]|uniref:Sel1 repeat-containing protein n=1 Tax=Marilutibacter chinensis TaxID=2912247 RepID=A0ABS9HVI4_9GAMM|nr:hypothetical protein [Lysobacter chinensis]MCF7222909.1 hypothetical protein [Lysobacter chinensis]